MQTQVGPPTDDHAATGAAPHPAAAPRSPAAWPAGDAIASPVSDGWSRSDTLPGLGRTRAVNAPQLAKLARSATRLLGDVEGAFDDLLGKLVVYSPERAEEALADLSALSRTCGSVTPRLMERTAGLVHRVVGVRLARFASTGRAAAGKLAHASVALREDVYRDGAEAVAEFAQHAVATGAALAEAARVYRAAVAEVDDVLDELWARCGDRFQIRPPHQILPHIVARPSVRIYINPLLGVGGDRVVAGLPMPGGPAIIPLPAHLVHWEKPATRPGAGG